MTAAGVRIRTSIAHSAIFLNIVLIPGGWGTTNPCSPVSIKPSAGIIKPFPGPEATYPPMSGKDGNDRDLSMENRNHSAPCTKYMRIPKGSLTDFPFRNLKKWERGLKKGMSNSSG
jgi:hypothetical protein